MSMPSPATIFSAAAVAPGVTVLRSVLAHGLSANSLASRYGRAVKAGRQVAGR
jgi:hypothetical protein